VADVLERLARIAGSGRGFDPVTRMAQKVSQVAERVVLAGAFLVGTAGAVALAMVLAR
jgi:hypothetical protein